MSKTVEADLTATISTIDWNRVKSTPELVDGLVSEYRNYAELARSNAEESERRAASLIEQAEKDRQRAVNYDEVVRLIESGALTDA